MLHAQLRVDAGHELQEVRRSVPATMNSVDVGLWAERESMARNTPRHTRPRPQPQAVRAESVLPRATALPPTTDVEERLEISALAQCVWEHQPRFVIHVHRGLQLH